ncbi:Pvc16 family protein [Marinobacter sp. TBZ242]|uniref:Pvc16 family protein n=1 Tax=Marinobacter azerbaijanicus TaxID=3050455 RepID=A0ABT7IH90_9GAMM|nr:Pvc16 family protein [Marinobacter sp. TBZ242]MDL0433538.1 Pvc16 family protein [Marinobacter sp. TBZ242]
MSNYTIIERVSEELRRQIFSALDEAPDTEFSVTDAATNIALEPPGENLNNQVVVSLYLYHISQQQRPRNPMPLRSGAGEEKHPPLPLQLKYLLLPVDNETNNQLMLGRILQHFHDHPVLESIAGEALDSSFGREQDQIRVIAEDIPLEQLTQLWNAFSQPMRLATMLRVDGVAIDSYRSPQQYGPVREAYTVLGQK